MDQETQNFHLRVISRPQSTKEPEQVPVNHQTSQVQGQPQLQCVKEKPKRFRKDRHQKGVFASGLWTLYEQKLYINFIEGHTEVIQVREARRSQKIFKSMSNIIKTRSPEQCRTHHQKMLIAHQSIKGIIEFKAYIEKCLRLREERMKEVMDREREEKSITKPIQIFGQGNHYRIYIQTECMLSYPLR